MKKQKIQEIITLGKTLSNGDHISAIYDPRTNQSSFVLFDNYGMYTIVKDCTDPATGLRYIPACDTDVREGLIVLPSHVGILLPNDELRSRIKAVLHRFIDFTDIQEEIATDYILLTYLFDSFEKIPYLRFIGSMGTGKSRALKVVGGLSFNSINLGVSQTPANLFRTLSKYGNGTLLMDEANFADTSRNSVIVQVLNSGYSSDGVVRRCDPKSYESRSYPTFGPKVIANHEYYSDPALESRMLTLQMHQTGRTEIPRTLNNLNRMDEIMKLRDDLLAFRISQFGKINPCKRFPELDTYNPRLQEIVLPLLWTLNQSTVPEYMLAFLSEKQEEMRQQALFDPETNVASLVVEKIKQGIFEIRPIDISRAYQEQNGEILSPRAIGGKLRNFGATPSLRDKNGAIYNLRKIDVEKLRKRYFLE